MPRRLTWVALLCTATVVFWGVGVLHTGASAPVTVTPPEAGPARLTDGSWRGVSTTANPARTPAPVATEGLGHIAGLLEGRQADDDEVEISAIAVDGDEQLVEALSSDPNSFELHLPPGRYQLRAATGAGRVGVVALVVVRADETARVTIALGDGAAVRGRVVDGRGAGVAGARVDVECPGGPSRGVMAEEDGRFEIAGLLPGRRCQVGVRSRRGDGSGDARWRVVSEVSVPGEVELHLPSGATLRGAIGAASGGCEFEEVVAVGTDLQEEVPVDLDCSFVFRDLQPGPLTVSAMAAGYHLRASVIVPPSGDPPALCLRPPCSEWPRATLTVALGPEREPSSLTQVDVRCQRHWTQCPCAAGECVCRELLAGAHAVVEAGPDHVEVNLQPGDNRVTLPRPRDVRYVGILRDRTGQAADDGSVRCAGEDGGGGGGGGDGGSGRVSGGLFHLLCHANDGGVEWRVGTGRWHFVARVARTGQATTLDILVED